MFERFTTAAREVVVRAKDEARRLRHPAVGASHLLLALLRTDGTAAHVLARHGVTAHGADRALAEVLSHDPSAGSTSRPDPDADAAALAAIGIDLARIRAALEAAFGPGVLETPDPAESPRRRVRGRARRSERGGLPFGADAKKALELSLREALRLNDGFIGDEHLLLGVLRGGDPVALRMLDVLGVDPAALRRDVEAERRRSA